MTSTTIADPKAEKATALLKITLTDADGVTPLLDLDSILVTTKVTLYEKKTGTIINSRTAQSILNTNGGTVYAALQTDAAGNTYNLLLRLDPDDMIIILGAKSEEHVALISWTWGSPLKTGHYEVVFTVNNLLKVT